MHKFFCDMDRLKDEDSGEYGALAGLAGVDDNRGLGRLPLARGSGWELYLEHEDVV